MSRYVVTVPLCLPKPAPAVFSCPLSSATGLQPSVIPTSPALPGPEDVFLVFFSNLFLVKALSGRRNKRGGRIAMEGPAVREQHSLSGCLWKTLVFQRKQRANPSLSRGRGGGWGASISSLRGFTSLCLVSHPLPLPLTLAPMHPHTPFVSSTRLSRPRGNGTIVPCLCLIFQKTASESAFSTLPLPENEIRTCP